MSEKISLDSSVKIYVFFQPIVSVVFKWQAKL